MSRISIISNSAFSLVNFRSHFIKDLVNNGCEVFALAPDYIEKFRKGIKEAGGEPVDIYMDRAGKNPVKDIGSVYNLTKALKELEPNITFSYGIKPVVYGLWASRAANIENRYAMVAGLGTMYSSNGSDSVRELANQKLADMLYRFSLRFAERVFFQNPDDIELFLGKNIISEDQPHLLNGSGVDIRHYHTDHIQKDPVTFTLTSRLIKEKGIYEFVDAARQLRAEYSKDKLRFILLGDVDANPNSVQESELNSWVNEGIIDWPGHVDNVKDWLEQTSVFVLPTWYREGTPKSMLEAMSMGRPVITTDMPGCREAVTDGQNGLFVPPRDASALADTMAEFIEKPSLIESMGAQSRQIAVQKYDVRKVNDELLSVMGLNNTAV